MRIVGTVVGAPHGRDSTMSRNVAIARLHEQLPGILQALSDAVYARQQRIKQTVVLMI